MNEDRLLTEPEIYEITCEVFDVWAGTGLSKTEVKDEKLSRYLLVRQDTKTANYYENIIIPLRCLEHGRIIIENKDKECAEKLKAEREDERKRVINEIVNLSYKTCGFDCKRCIPMSTNCTWLQSQLKQQEGIE